MDDIAHKSDAGLRFDLQIGLHVHISTVGIFSKLGNRTHRLFYQSKSCTFVLRVLGLGKPTCGPDPCRKIALYSLNLHQVPVIPVVNHERD